MSNKPIYNKMFKHLTNLTLYSKVNSLLSDISSDKSPFSSLRSIFTRTPITI